MNNKRKDNTYINIKLNEKEKAQLAEVAKEFNFKTISALITHIAVDGGDVLVNVKHTAYSNISRAKNLLKYLREVRFKGSDRTVKNLTLIEKRFNKIQTMITIKRPEVFVADGYKLKAKNSEEQRVNFKIRLDEKQIKKVKSNTLKNQFYSKSSLLKYPLFYYQNGAVEDKVYVLETIRLNLTDLVLRMYKNPDDAWVKKELKRLYERTKTVIENIKIKEV